MNFPGIDHWPPILILAISLVLCAGFLRVARDIGKYFGLVDKPSARKHHRGHIPLVGGISIFLTCVVMYFASHFATAVIVAGGLLLLVGMTDDYLDLTPLSRLVYQGIAACILVVGGGYQITSIGSLIGEHIIVLSGIAAIVFSIICVIGVVNAINMIDGADGLAGGIVSISITGLLFFAINYGTDTYLVGGLLTILGATIAFIIFNSGFLGYRKKVFLGDSGSMFLGIVLASYFIGMSQGEAAYMTPVVAGWIFGLPLMDSISVMVGRTLLGKSPLKAGRDHLHHQLMDNGMSSAACVLVMLTLHATLVLIGVVGNHFSFPMPVMFWGFVTLTIAHHFVTPKLIEQFNQRNNTARTRSRRYS